MTNASVKTIVASKILIIKLILKLNDDQMHGLRNFFWLTQTVWTTTYDKMLLLKQV
jgi:hypothetical protein